MKLELKCDSFQRIFFLKQTNSFVCKSFLQKHCGLTSIHKRNHYSKGMLPDRVFFPDNKDCFFPKPYFSPPKLFLKKKKIFIAKKHFLKNKFFPKKTFWSWKLGFGGNNSLSGKNTLIKQHDLKENYRYRYIKKIDFETNFLFQ